MTDQELFKQTLEVLIDARDNTVECLNNVLPHAGYARYDRRIAGYKEQITDQDKLIIALRARFAQPAAELRRLHAHNTELMEALTAVFPYIATQAIGCHGYKCREPWCWSCNGQEDAQIAAKAALDACAKARAAIKKAEGQS